MKYSALEHELSEARNPIPEDVRLFFEILEKSIPNETKKELGKSLIKYFKERVFSNKPAEEVLASMIRIKMHLLLLLSRMNNKRYIYAVDNIEYLLRA